MNEYFSTRWGKPSNEGLLYSCSSFLLNELHLAKLEYGVYGATKYY